MAQAHAFADDPQPECVWRKRGTYADLFMFLADRFCGAPDHVLDGESVHAQWKHMETSRRGLKFKLLNALLKLRHHRFTYGRMPPWEELQEQIEFFSAGRAARYAALIANQTHHPRALHDQPYQERFQLRAIDVALIRQVDDASGGHDGADDKPAAQTADVAFANYVRFLFRSNNLYKFNAIAVREGRDRYVFVTENKSVARDAIKHGLVSGRPLNVIWYEPASESAEIAEELDADEQLLYPCSGDSDALLMQEMTIAELSIAAGYYPHDILPHYTERDVELLHERRILHHNIEIFDSRRVRLTSGATWARIVNCASGTDIEWHAFEDRPESDLTKMALARALQVRDDLTDDARDRVWALPKNVLNAALANQPAAIAKAKARAKPPAGGRGGGHRGGRGGRG